MGNLDIIETEDEKLRRREVAIPKARKEAIVKLR
jgi:hypothetical protein